MAETRTTPPLERDALIAEAMRRSGLDDIGDTWFFEPLDKMLQCLIAEAQFTPRGAAMEAEKNVGYLINRLTRVELLKKHPRFSTRTYRSPPRLSAWGAPAAPRRTACSVPRPATPS